MPPKTGAICSLVTKILGPVREGEGLMVGGPILGLVRLPEDVLTMGWPPREGAMGGLNQFNPVQGKKGAEPLAEGQHDRAVRADSNGGRAPEIRV